MRFDQAVQSFLDLPRIAVAGVSRAGNSPANAIAERLRETEHEVFAVNPASEKIDGYRCYPSVNAIDGGVDGVVVVTRPSEARQVVADAKQAGASWVWFHQGLGPVSFDDAAVQAAKDAGLNVIAAGCPMMYCKPDGFHLCARGLFRIFGRIPKDIDVSA